MRPHLWGLAAIAAVAVAAVAVVSVLLARGTPSTPSAGPTGADKGATVAAPLAPTLVHRVAPVGGSGRLAAGYRVTTSGRGHCFGTSLVDDRLYRCFVGNQILDPCWRSGGQRVLCLVEPWSRQVVRVRLTAPLPPRQAFGHRVWGLQVGDGIGARCTASMWATGTVAGRPVSYVCSQGWMLLGSRPDRSAGTWTMGTARRVAGHARVQGTHHLAQAWVTAG